MDIRNKFSDEMNALLDKYMRNISDKGCCINMKDMAYYLRDNKNRYIEYLESCVYDDSNSIYQNFITEYETMKKHYSLTYKLCRKLEYLWVTSLATTTEDILKNLDDQDKWGLKDMNEYRDLIRGIHKSITMGDPRNVCELINRR